VGRRLLPGSVWFLFSRRAPALLIQQVINLLFQSGQVVFDGAPDNVDVNIKVIVDRLVAHAPHLDPR
jgi:hypothetical protein